MEFIMKKEEDKDRILALSATIIIHLAILLFLIFYFIITPIPPYPEAGGPELELDFGNMINGTGKTESHYIGNGTVSEKQNRINAKTPANHNTPLLTSEAENSVALNKGKKKTEVQKTDTAHKLEEQKISVELASIEKKFKSSKGNAGGNGNSGQEGNAGSPNGTTPGTGEGIGNGQGDQMGSGIQLSGRTVLIRPHTTGNSIDQGIVVVLITVDKSGNVIKAEPGQKGSTTSSPVLLAKAKEASLQAKFNASPQGVPEQQGYITFNFGVQ